MEAWDSLCPGCFAEKGDVAVCAYCGHDEAERRTPLVLPYRTILNGQFIVGKVLGKPGGFGITYLGWDINLATLVAVKEYLPRDYAGRDTDHATVMAHSKEDAGLFRFGLEQFLQEARTLARFDHPNVVRTRSFFEQHGTAYLVMDYLQGVNLAEYLIAQGGRLTEQQASGIMMPIIAGLQEVHAKGFLHRDIKPQNIYVTSTGRPILLDFGAARQAMGERSRSLSVVLTPGFSPYEQYHRRGEQGPWTDIYALAATYYYLLAGQAPPDAPERVAADELIPLAAIIPGISPGLNAAIMQALCLEASSRPQDVFIFRNLINGEIVPSQPAAASSLRTPPPLPQANPAFSRSPAGVSAVPSATSAPPVAQPVSPAPQAAQAQAAPPVLSHYPPQYQAGIPPYPPPPSSPPARKASSGIWIAAAGIVVVMAVAGWLFFGGSENDKRDVPAASTPATATPAATPTAPAAQPTGSPTQAQPFAPVQPTGTNKPAVIIPSKPAEPEKTPAEAVPPPPASPDAPRQQPVVRTQPPTDKPVAPTPPKREKGSLW